MSEIVGVWVGVRVKDIVCEAVRLDVIVIDNVTDGVGVTDAVIDGVIVRDCEALVFWERLWVSEDDCVCVLLPVALGVRVCVLVVTCEFVCDEEAPRDSDCVCERVLEGVCDDVADVVRVDVCEAVRVSVEVSVGVDVPDGDPEDDGVHDIATVDPAAQQEHSPEQSGVERPVVAPNTPGGQIVGEPPLGQ